MTRNGAILVVAAGLIVTSAGTAPSRPWPPPLVESTAVLTPEVSAALECVWATPTLRRRVHAGSARAPLEVYLAFLDTPEVTAAAARFLKLASYDVHVLDDDRYEGDDVEGARGFSQVLRRDRQRRVIFSQGEYTGPIFGTVRGSALMVLDLEPRGDSIEPNLAAYLYVEDHLAAGLTRLFAGTLGFLADRELTRGLRITAEVAEWAVNRPGDFCAWLAREPLATDRRHRIVAALPACSRTGQSLEIDRDEVGGRSLAAAGSGR